MPAKLVKLYIDLRRSSEEHVLIQKEKSDTKKYQLEQLIAKVEERVEKSIQIESYENYRKLLRPGTVKSPERIKMIFIDSCSSSNFEVAPILSGIH
ncbi:hypothetical protein LguiB_007210 [Lonicera macranthoides]